MSLACVDDNLKELQKTYRRKDEFLLPRLEYDEKPRGNENSVKTDFGGTNDLRGNTSDPLHEKLLIAQVEKRGNDDYDNTGY